MFRCSLLNTNAIFITAVGTWYMLWRAGFEMVWFIVNFRWEWLIWAIEMSEREPTIPIFLLWFIDSIVWSQMWRIWNKLCIYIYIYIYIYIVTVLILTNKNPFTDDTGESNVWGHRCSNSTVNLSGIVSMRWNATWGYIFIFPTVGKWILEMSWQMERNRPTGE